MLEASDRVDREAAALGQGILRETAGFPAQARVCAKPALLGFVVGGVFIVHFSSTLRRAISAIGGDADPNTTCA